MTSDDSRQHFGVTDGVDCADYWLQLALNDQRVRAALVFAYERKLNLVASVRLLHSLLSHGQPFNWGMLGHPSVGKVIEMGRAMASLADRLESGTPVEMAESASQATASNLLSVALFYGAFPYSLEDGIRLLGKDEVVARLRVFAQSAYNSSLVG